MEAWVVCAVLAFFQAVALLVSLVLLKRINRHEAALATQGSILAKFNRELVQLHRESVSDISTFAQMNDHIQRIEDYVNGDLGDEIELIDLALRAHLKGHEDSGKTRATEVPARASSYVRGRGHGRTDGTARRRRV